MLTRVVPGSAAAQAGLAARDRVYQVDGRDFADGQEFGQLVTGAAGPVCLLVERQGVLQTHTLRPLEVLLGVAVPAEPGVEVPASPQEAATQ
jgi:S1-C subfamily serine protease